jgi:hypothetical protein
MRSKWIGRLAAAALLYPAATAAQDVVCREDAPSSEATRYHGEPWKLEAHRPSAVVVTVRPSPNGSAWRDVVIGKETFRMAVSADGGQLTASTGSGGGPAGDSSTFLALYKGDAVPPRAYAYGILIHTTRFVAGHIFVEQIPLICP